MTRKRKCQSKANSFVAAAEQVCLQPVLKHRQRRGWRNIAWQAIPYLCSSNRKGTTSDSWPTFAMFETFIFHYLFFSSFLVLLFPSGYCVPCMLHFCTCILPLWWIKPSSSKWLATGERKDSKWLNSEQHGFDTRRYCNWTTIVNAKPAAESDIYDCLVLNEILSKSATICCTNPQQMKVTARYRQTQKWESRLTPTIWQYFPPAILNLDLWFWLWSRRQIKQHAQEIGKKSFHSKVIAQTYRHRSGHQTDWCAGP